MPVAHKRVLAALETLAPLRLAADWDNVGLLVEHATARRIKQVLLTIDLTCTVLDEAIALGCELIVAYHPPIFRPLSRLTMGDPKQRLVLRTVQKGIAIYSPHTALDAVEGGVNDWLADGLGKGYRRSIEAEPVGGGQRITATMDAGNAEPFARVAIANGATVQVDVHGEFATVTVDGGGDVMRRLLDAFVLAEEDDAHHSILELTPRLRSTSGQGRLVSLDRPVALKTVVGRIKRHLGLSRVRVATAERHRTEPIATVALCPGAGGSVVCGQPAQLLWTGEMRHHDVVAALDRGSSVVLCDHTNTERGYLPHFAKRLRKELGTGVRVTVAKRDREPLDVV